MAEQAALIEQWEEYSRLNVARCNSDKDISTVLKVGI